MARSRYSNSAIIDGKYYESFSIDQRNEYEPSRFSGVRVREYTVKLGDRLDHLAAKYLNDDEYWWVIALVSDLASPFVTPGQKILIPFNVQDVLDRM